MSTTSEITARRLALEKKREEQRLREEARKAEEARKEKEREAEEERQRKALEAELAELERAEKEEEEKKKAEREAEERRVEEEAAKVRAEEVRRSQGAESSKAAGKRAEVRMEEVVDEDAEGDEEVEERDWEVKTPGNWSERRTGKRRCARCARDGEVCQVDQEALAAWKIKREEKPDAGRGKNTTCRWCAFKRKKCELPELEGVEIPAKRKSEDKLGESSKRRKTERR
jgi:hypothetical protein